jgi:thymidylate synthase
VIKIKEIIRENKDIKDTKTFENELKEVENSRDLLNEEFRENLLSKESYDELKEKYEKKIEDLKAEIERNRKVV